MDQVNGVLENRLILSLFPNFAGIPGHLAESQDNRDLEELVLRQAHEGTLPPVSIWFAGAQARVKTAQDAQIVRILWDAGFKCLLVQIFPDEKGASLGRGEGEEDEEDDIDFLEE